MDKNKIVLATGIGLMALAIAVCVLTILLGPKEQYWKNYSDTIDEIMADNVEIERKWLIDKDSIPYDMSNAEVVDIEQTYICFSPEFRIRRLNRGESYSCAFKDNLSVDGLVRDEIDTSLSKEEYETLLAKGEGMTIHKTRYQFLDEEGYLIAIDIFHDELDGLAYMEIEFTDTETAMEYGNPDWVIEDVTDEVEYKNGYLARYGFPDNYEEKRRRAGYDK